MLPIPLSSFSPDFKASKVRNHMSLTQFAFILESILPHGFFTVKTFWQQTDSISRKTHRSAALQRTGGLLQSFPLGKSKGVLKYICLSFISFLPLFYFCCIYYFGSLIFCCQFVASFIITGADKFDNIQFENSAYLSLFYKIISTRIILTFIIRIIDIFFRIIQKCFFFNKSNI